MNCSIGSPLLLDCVYQSEMGKAYLTSSIGWSDLSDFECDVCACSSKMNEGVIFSYSLVCLLCQLLTLCAVYFQVML